RGGPGRLLPLAATPTGKGSAGTPGARSPNRSARAGKLELPSVNAAALGRQQFGDASHDNLDGVYTMLLRVVFRKRLEGFPKAHLERGMVTQVGQRADVLSAGDGDG